MPLRLPEMDPCYFCQLIAGADRWNILEETALTFTMLNGRQYEQGQCLVVPLRHAPTLLDLTTEEEAAVMAAARRAAQALVKAFDPDGVLVYQTNGRGSGQEVPHFHMHVVPRTSTGDWGSGPPHLAEVEKPRAHLDYAVITDAKRRTAEIIRGHF
jgi:diadenosine tetraphosphate (Ap4A) HIT family hydrolase